MAAQQSPVDIAGHFTDGAPTLELAYDGVADHITNTGDFVKANYEEGGCLRLNGRMYHLSEIHAHNPGEHTIDGERFALEAHLVHTRGSGEIAVVGILYRLAQSHRRGGPVRSDREWRMTDGGRRALFQRTRPDAGCVRCAKRDVDGPG